MKKPSNLDKGQGRNNQNWWREKGFVWGRTCLRKDLDDKELDQNKMLYSSSGVELPIVNYHTDSPTLRQRDRSPVTGPLLALEPHWLRFLFVASSLLPHLAYFLARSISHPCFCFAESWIVGLAMSKAESRGVGADSFYFVFLVVARLKLWLILMTYWR